MTEAAAIDLGQKALTLVLMLAGPPLILTLVAGVMVSVFQVATQINESTLTFVPKILAVFAAFLVFGHWMLDAIVTFTTQLLEQLPAYAR